MRAEALLAGFVGRPERPHENISRHLIQINAAGKQPVQHRADAADLLNRFVSHMNDGLHIGGPF